jgi:hypothetical protein
MTAVSLATSVVAVAFSVDLTRRWLSDRSRRSLLWWTMGVIAYGTGTAAAAAVDRWGWSPAGFRTWYIAGAILGGVLLAQGTAYLVHRKGFADQLASSVAVLAGGASLAVILSPVIQLDGSELAGASLDWAWVRAFTPVLNTYAVAYLAGGAILSAVRYRRSEGSRAQVLGSVLIAMGGITPALGGVASRLGGGDALPLTLFAGLLLIWLGATAVARG